MFLKAKFLSDAQYFSPRHVRQFLKLWKPIWCYILHKFCVIVFVSDTKTLVYRQIYLPPACLKYQRHLLDYYSGE